MHQDIKNNLLYVSGVKICCDERLLACLKQGEVIYSQDRDCILMNKLDSRDTRHISGSL